jgi:hypothetical protein
METEIKQWITFIESILVLKIEPIEFECVVDRKHTHKFKSGKWHIYSFWLCENNKALKIGVAGPNSAARFDSQHYNENSSNSNLAKSLLKEKMCSDEDAKSWIRSNTYRINIVFDNFSKPLAHALEAHLHVLFEPYFEK